MTLTLFVLRMVEIFSHIFLLSAIMSKKIKKKEYIISTLIVVVLYELVTIVIPEKYKLIIAFVILTITVSLVSKINIYQVMIGYSITGAIILILDVVNGIILFMLLDIDKFNEVLEMDAYYNLAIVMMSVLILMIEI